MQLPDLSRFYIDGSWTEPVSPYGFDLIDPCKMRGLPITSIADLTGIAPHPDSVCEHLAHGIARRC